MALEFVDSLVFKDDTLRISKYLCRDNQRGSHVVSSDERVRCLTHALGERKKKGPTPWWVPVLSEKREGLEARELWRPNLRSPTEGQVKFGSPVMRSDLGPLRDFFKVSARECQPEVGF